MVGFTEASCSPVARIGAAFVTCLFAIENTACGSAPSLVPPNIVLFYADDMGIGDTSAYQDLTLNPNEHQVSTPNIEALATLGMRFTDAYSGAGVCTPSRIALLSGTYSFRSPLRQLVSFVGQDTGGSLFPGDRRTIAWMLRRAGYATFGYGKWHLGVQSGDPFGTGLIDEGPLQLGFDTFTGTSANFGDGIRFNRGGLLINNRYMTYNAGGELVNLDAPDAVDWSDPRNPDLITRTQQLNFDAMVSDLNEFAESGEARPFFLYYASHSNHDPYVTAAQIAGVPLTTAVSVAGLPIPVNVGPDDDGDGIPEPDDDLWDPKDSHWDPYYVAGGRPGAGTNGPTERGKMIVENDTIVGEILAFLSSTEDPRDPGRMLIDNTLFLVTSDNGADMQGLPAVGGLPQAADGEFSRLRGKKATRWEGGARVPLIAVWPGRIPAGSTSNAVVSQVDLYATLAELVGHVLEPNEAVDSVTVLGALTRGEAGVVRPTDLVFKQREHLQIRRGALKLHATESDWPGQSDRYAPALDFADLMPNGLYDLSVDLGESQNLAGDPSYTPVAGDMLATLNLYVAQGYSRPGAEAILPSLNFLGGDFQNGANWASYTAALNGRVPGVGASATAFIAVDGHASTSVRDARVVQRGGVFEFASQNSWESSIADGATWLLEGGLLRDENSAIRVDNGGVLIVDGGQLDVLTDQNFLRLTQGDGRIELRRGEARASVLTFGVLDGSRTAGSKIVRFGRGRGTLVLGSADPIRFGDDGDPWNDFIDFTAESRGTIVSSMGLNQVQELWGSGRLRIDGQSVTELGGALLDWFSLGENGDGSTSLSLLVGSGVADIDRSGSVDMFDLIGFLERWDAADQLADLDGSTVVDHQDLDLFVRIAVRESK